VHLVGFIVRILLENLIHHSSSRTERFTTLLMPKFAMTV